MISPADGVEKESTPRTDEFLAEYWHDGGPRLNESAMCSEHAAALIAKFARMLERELTALLAANRALKDNVAQLERDQKELHEEWVADMRGYTEALQRTDAAEASLAKIRGEMEILEEELKQYKQDNGIFGAGA